MFTRYACLATLSSAAVVCGGVEAADLNARDFVSAPVGTSVGVAYLPLVRANDYHGAADSTGKADLAVNVFAYRQLWFSDICGILCTPQFVVSYVDTEARLPGAAERTSDHGIGDPQIGGTLFFINDPEARTYSGLLTMLSVPPARALNARSHNSAWKSRLYADSRFTRTNAPAAAKATRRQFQRDSQ